MFHKSLADLVKGLRAHKKDERQFIASCLKDIKEELRSTDNELKVEALRKLSYLQMFGFDISWSAFNAVEAMASQVFWQKRIGYMVACAAIKPGSEVTLLTTNLFKKDLLYNQSPFEASIAMNTLANIMTPELASDLATDIVSLMSHSRHYLRKRSTLLTFKIFRNYPEALRPTFPQLKEKLQDPEVAVVSAAVNVICELARKNPKNYLALAPIFFKILTSSGNNWMLIKIIKLLGALCPLEPRLAKKLTEPLTNIISTTPAKSLLYECISTATSGITENKPLMELCTEKLRGFVAEPDPNLKFLGLVGLCNVIKHHPRLIAPHKDVILECLDDEDVTIRMRVLELLAGMASKKNLPDICRKLREHIEKSDGQYRDNLVKQLVATCSQDTYEFINDFEWYLGMLVELAMIRGLGTETLISDQIVDITVRVESLRGYAFEQVVQLMHNEHIMSESATDCAIQEVLYAAAWVTGEFASTCSDYSEALAVLLQPRIAFMPAHVQAVFVQAAFKVFVAAIDNLAEDSLGMDGAASLRSLFTDRMQLFSRSVHVEVQERACSYQALVDIVAPGGGLNAPLAGALMRVFNTELIPVSAKAQSKVKVPAGLDLDSWINEEPTEPEPVDNYSESNIFSIGATDTAGDADTFNPAIVPMLSKKEIRRMEREKKRLLKLRKKDPFYLAATQNIEDDVSIEEIPISELDLSHMDKPEKKSKKSKKEKKNAGAAAEDRPAVVVKKFMDEPEGNDNPTHVGRSQGVRSKADDALDIDLSGPLRKDEMLKETKEYKMQTAEDVEREIAKKERAKRRQEKEARRKEREDKKLDQMGDVDMLMGEEKPKKIEQEG
jgi:AP-3 complex subunit delta-1